MIARTANPNLSRVLQVLSIPTPESVAVTQGPQTFETPVSVPHHQSASKLHQQRNNRKITATPTASMDTIRSALQPITQNLPTPIYTLGNNLLGPSCYKHLILDIDPIANPDCVKLAISKGLGIGIVGASSIVKIPQLLKLLNSQSAAGVSFLAYLLETASLVTTLAYNARQGNPFSTYGESALIAAQNVAISTVVLHYSGKDAGATVFIAGLAAALYALFSPGVVDAKMMGFLQAGAGVLGVASKIPQIFAVYSQGGTGQLSAFAVCEISSNVVWIYANVTAVGLQLPRRLTLAHLHDTAGSRRSAHPLRLHRWIRSQCHSSRADGILLEFACKQEFFCDKDQGWKSE